jgi:hypothetical protein
MVSPLSAAAKDPCDAFYSAEYHEQVAHVPAEGIDTDKEPF